MSFWNDLIQTIGAKITELISTNKSYLTLEEYMELYAKETASMLTEERKVWERDIVMVSRKMRHVFDEDGNIVKNVFTGKPLEVPTKDVCKDLCVTRAALVEDLAEEYVTDVDVDGADVTTTWGDGHTKTETVNNVANADTASKLGTATVGSGVRHIYLNSGTPTASSSTVGGTAQPMYLNSGTMTACSASAGSADTPVYMENGVIKACSSSLGGGGGLTVAVYSGYSGSTLNFSSVSGSFTATNYEVVLLYIPPNSRISGVEVDFSNWRNWNVDGKGSFSVYNPSGGWSIYGHGNPLLVMFYDNRWHGVGVYGGQIDNGGGDGGGE